MTKSGIEWTGRSDWNPMRGCTRVSEGCRNCFAERIAGRFSAPGLPFHKFATQTPGGGRWTGKVEMVPGRLDLPLRWRKPARIFVNSTFDLFHKDVPDDWIDEVFAIMAAAHWHTFQVLTKRPERMAQYLADYGVKAAGRWVEASKRMSMTSPAFNRVGWGWAAEDMPWPLPNIWLGVSVEDQRRADERIPDLLATPAAVRWVSAEPLLGHTVLHHIRPRAGDTRIINALSGDVWYPGCGSDSSQTFRGARIDWVVAGGESGPRARDVDTDAFYSLRDQCKSAGVAFFMKQMPHRAPIPDDLMVREYPR